MDAVEWESLCNSCGRCCLVKLEDSDSHKVAYPNIACQLLDINTCRCADHENRKQRVAACLMLDAESLGAYSDLPPACVD